ILVTGHLDYFFEPLKKKYSSVVTIKNNNYANTSSMGSFYCAKELIGDEDILLLEGDLIYEKNCLDILVSSPEKDTILLSEDKKMSDDYYYEIIDNGIGKLTFNLFEIKGEYGELTGLQKLSNELCQLMFKKYEDEKNLKLGYEYCMEKIAKERKIFCKRVDGIIWSEIDDEFQLNRVMETIYPKLLEKGEN
ncbi:phosphocholine cytidylyltransferase family protein, partial [Fusobacterium ulcerans]|uniref:phosphocholine cytidylyltransferase family protein n=1 Tax=Fusobacterium ulcerans TaxID=861 RepID=UPI0026EC5BD0